MQAPHRPISTPMQTRWCRARKSTARRTGCASDVLPDHDRRGEDAHAGRKDPGGADRAVCSPGGTTLAGSQVLEERDLYGMVAEACDKCTARAYELGK